MGTMTKRQGSITQLFLLVAILSLAAFARLGIAEEQTVEKPFSRGDPTIVQGRILISTMSTNIVLKPGAPRLQGKDKRSFPIEVQGNTRIRVESVLPTWGATVEALELRGPDGVVPLDRLLVRAGGEGGEFLPLSGRVPLVTGDYRSQVEEVPLDILFCPTWRDRPGRYEGRLLLRPTVSQAVWRNVTTNPTASEGLADEGPGEFNEQSLGEAQKIGVEFESPQIISIVLSSDQLLFDATAGAGIFAADEDIVMEISTNASIWRVECQASPLVSNEREIPVSRILWERLDDFGNVVDSGNLEDQPLVFEGHEPAVGAVATLRFKIRIFMYDVAAVYHGTLSMLGTAAGGKHKEDPKIREEPQ